MPRNSKRKTNRSLTYSKRELQQAVDEVKLRNMSLVETIRWHSENIVKEYGGINFFSTAQKTKSKEIILFVSKKLPNGNKGYIENGPP